MSASYHAIVLAAGSASRFGGGKLTAPLGEGVLLDGALEAAFAAPAGKVVVTWGADRAVADAAWSFTLAWGGNDRLILAEARDHAHGLSASLRAGLAALPADAAGAFLFLGDMPRIPRDLAARLAERLADPVLAAAPLCAGVRGHPVLVSRQLFADLAALEGDQGARRLLDGLGERLALIETADDGVLFDVDRPEDLCA
jgi:molybdenum cofactor cytidylyltransferase